MIIKIMKNDDRGYVTDEFWVCDNVEFAHVDRVSKPFSKEAIKEVMAETAKVVCCICENRQEAKVWAIHFRLKHDDDRRVAIFNTIAYLCNDSGKTVETIFG